MDGIPNFVDPYPWDSGNNNYTTTYTWQDSDGDGMPDESDPYPYDATNNWWESYYATMWQDWGDNDADGLPNFSDPYPNDASNNTTQWYAPQPLLIDGSLQTPGGTYATDTLDWSDYDGDGLPAFAAPYPWDASNNTTQWTAAQDYLVDGGTHSLSGVYASNGLDWNDEDGDELPNFADPYPQDPDNNTALWWAQSWVDGAAQDLIGAYAANTDTSTWSDLDEDGLPDWLDPYPEDAANNTSWWWGNAWVDGGMEDIGGSFAADQSASISWEDSDEDGLPDWLDPYPEDAENNTAWWYDESYVDGELQSLIATYAADGAAALSWEDGDFDGLPDWADPYPEDFSNNTIWWEGEFLIDGTRVTVSGWFADEGPDWNDDDGDWLPNFIDPYAQDASNNTAFWNGAAWIDGQWQEIAEPYPASSAETLDLSDNDSDTLPDVFDPYPEDATNNTAQWQGGEFVIDGETRVLTGAGERYAVDGGDVDGDHIPDFADPYPEDAANDGREPVFEEPVVSAPVNTEPVSVSVPPPVVSAPVLDTPAVSTTGAGGIPAPSVNTPAVPPAPVLDDAALLALLSTGSLPAQPTQTQEPGTAPDETPFDPFSDIYADEVARLVAEIDELAQRTSNVGADTQALGWIMLTLQVEPGGDPAAALAEALRFKQTPHVTAQDADGDGLDDLAEITVHLSNPTEPDTDGDGFFDGWESDHGLDPLDPQDNQSADTDADGLSNEEELNAGTDPGRADSDYGGVIDGIETRMARLRQLLGENTPQYYSATNPLDPQDDTPPEEPQQQVPEPHEDPEEETEEDSGHDMEQTDETGGACTSSAGGDDSGAGNEGMDDEEAEQDEPQDMGGPGQMPPDEPPQETLREKWAREKREREAVLQERRDRLHEKHVAGVKQRAAQREQQREMNHHLSHPHGNHGVGVKNAGSRGWSEPANRPAPFQPTDWYALSHGYDNVTRTWLNERPANETLEQRNTRLHQDWLERKALRDQQRVFWHPHGNHGNGVISTGARGRYSADNLDGALAFQASEGYAQTDAYKDMLRRDYVRGIVDSVIAQEGGNTPLTAAEKQALVRVLQNEDRAKPLSSYKIAAITRGALNTAAAADTLDASAPALHRVLTGLGRSGPALTPQTPAEVLAELAGNDPYQGMVPAHHRYSWEDTDGDGVSNQDEWDLNTDADDAGNTPTLAALAELERQRIEAAKTAAEREAERLAAERERLRLEAEAWQMTLEAEHAAQREYELSHPELVRQTGDRMLVENFTPIVKVDENGRPLMLVRRTGPDGKDYDVWATPKDQELADNFVKNSAGEWEPRGEQERHRKFADARFISDYLVPSMQQAQGSTMAFVEVNAAIATVVAGGAGVTGFAPKVIGMSKEALSELTGIPVGLKDLKDLFSRKAINQLDEMVRDRTIYNVTEDFEKIVTSKRVWGQTEGSVYGMTTANAPRWRSMADTPIRDPGLIIFEGEAARLFNAHPIEGPYSGIKRLLGQQKAGFGDIVLDNFERSGNSLLVTSAHLAPHAGQSTAWAAARLWGRRLVIEPATAATIGAGIYYGYDTFFGGN